MDAAEILQMAQGGLKPKAIAEELGVTVATVRKVLKDNALPTSPSGIDEKGVIDAYKEDTPVTGILKEFSISYSSLYRILAANNIPIRQLAQADGHRMQLDQAVKMYKAGQPLWAIRQETGVSQPTLHAELHRLNIPLRRPRIL